MHGAPLLRARALQAHSALTALPIAGWMEVPTAEQRVALIAVEAEAAQALRTSCAPPQAGLGATFMRATADPAYAAVMEAAAAAATAAAAAAAAGETAEQDAGCLISMPSFLPDALCVGTAFALDWAAQQGGELDDCCRELCLR